MKTKTPTNKEIGIIFLTGLGLLSFGLIFIWIPVFGDILLFLGAILFLIAISTFITKVLK